MSTMVNTNAFLMMKYIIWSKIERTKLEIHSLINENDIKSKKQDDVWESCCLRTDRHTIAYIGQFIFSMTVLAFCAIMIIRAHGDCNNVSPFVSIISFLMGKFKFLMGERCSQWEILK